MDVTRTSTLLLDGLRDRANSLAWAQFDNRYRPILFGLLRSLGANDTDAADVAQETMVRFLEQYGEGQYDRGRGRLKSWILAIARTQLALQRRRGARRREVQADTAALERDVAEAGHEGVSADEWSRLWDEERRRAILVEAFARLKVESGSSGRTLDAFELLVFRAVPPAAVAQELGMTLADVYQAKSRVTDRLRRHIDDLETAFDDEL